MSRAHRPARRRVRRSFAEVSRGTCASCCESAVMNAAPDQSPCLMMHTLCRRTAATDRERPVTCGHSHGQGSSLTRGCLLALGLVGDLGELRFCCSETVGPCAWCSSLVVIGHCRATSDGPGTAQASAYQPASRLSMLTTGVVPQVQALRFEGSRKLLDEARGTRSGPSLKRTSHSPGTLKPLIPSTTKPDRTGEP